MQAFTIRNKQYFVVNRQGLHRIHWRRSLFAPVVVFEKLLIFNLSFLVEMDILLPGMTSSEVGFLLISCRNAPSRKDSRWGVCFGIRQFPLPVLQSCPIHSSGPGQPDGTYVQGLGKSFCPSVKKIGTKFRTFRKY